MTPSHGLHAHIYRNKVLVIRDTRPLHLLMFIQWTVKDKDGVETVREFAYDLTNMELAT